MKPQELIDLVKASFKAEQDCDIRAGLELIHPDFTVVEMSEWYDGTTLKSLGGKDVRDLMKRAFTIKGREYDFKTIMANEASQTVIAEFVESYPDPKTGQVYRTPQVAICEIKDGKIYRTRHYNDPRLSYKQLSTQEIHKAFD